MYDMDQSSFVIQPYRRKYLKAYFKQMSQDDTTMLWDDNVASVLQEQGFSIEQNPRSVYKVEKLYAWLKKYDPAKCPSVNLNDEHIKSGISLAYLAFGRKSKQDRLSVKDFSPELVLSITSNRQGSPGLTAWGQTKVESYTRAYERGVQILDGEKAPEPCIAFKRTQSGDKTRLVWGYPYSMTAIEGLFARPLINLFLKGQTPMSFGKTTGYMGCELRTASYSNQWSYATDMSSFDSSIAPELIQTAFKILRTWFDMDQEIKIANNLKIKLRDVWSKIVAYFIHTPIVMPDGNLYKGKKHGVPSGSYFTQLIDSIVNTIIVGAISSKFKMSVPLNHIMVLGDDVIFWSNRNVDLNHIAQYASNVFKATFNAKKCGKYRYDEPIKYLGRIWTNGVPDLPDSEIIAKMVQPERFRKYSKDPKERARQVRLLLLSYASVYRSGYKLFLQCAAGGKLFNRTNDSAENYALNGGETDAMRKFFSEHGSGLLRYLSKYVYQEPRVISTSALTYWR